MYKPQRIKDREPENYFISMTDMMVGVLFVFIIMLMAFALNLKSTEAKTTGNYETRKEILKQIEKELASQGVKVILDLENGILRLPEEVLFDSGRADIKERGQDALKKLHGAFAIILPCYVETSDINKDKCNNERQNYIDTIFIEGHTDNIPIQTVRYKSNWDLSAARAIETFQILSSHKPKLDALRNSFNKPIFSVSGYADTRGTESNNSDIGRRKNRRIDIRFVMSTPRPEEVEKVKEQIRENF